MYGKYNDLSEAIYYGAPSQEILLMVRTPAIKSIINIPVKWNSLTCRRFNYTPLHLAVYDHQKRTDLPKILLEAGANIEARESFGMTPLLLGVCYYESNKIPFQIIQTLLQNNANSNAVCNNSSDKYYGWTPLQIALANGYEDIVRILLEYKADPDMPIQYGVDVGKTPLALIDEKLKNLEQQAQYNYIQPEVLEGITLTINKFKKIKSLIEANKCLKDSFKTIKTGQADAAIGCCNKFLNNRINGTEENSKEIKEIFIRKAYAYLLQENIDDDIIKNSLEQAKSDNNQDYLIQGLLEQCIKLLDYKQKLAQLSDDYFKSAELCISACNAASQIEFYYLRFIVLWKLKEYGYAEFAYEKMKKIRDDILKANSEYKDVIEYLNTFFGECELNLERIENKELLFKGKLKVYSSEDRALNHQDENHASLEQTLKGLNQTLEILQINTVDNQQLETKVTEERTKIEEIIEGKKKEVERQINELKAELQHTATQETQEKLQRDIKIQEIELATLKIDAQLEVLLQNHLVKLEKKEKQAQLKSEPKLWRYYQAIQTCLGRFFIRCYSGNYNNKKSETIKWTQLGIELFGDVMSAIPVVNLLLLLAIIPKWIAKGSEIANSKYQDKISENISNLDTLPNLLKEIEIMARQLTNWYELLIQELATEQDAYKAAEFIVVWAIDAIINNEITDQKSLAEQLVFIITTKGEEPLVGIKKLENAIIKRLGELTVKTTQNNEWNLWKMYTESAILTEDGDYYSIKGGRSAYGQCKGTKEAALMRNLELQGKSKKNNAITPTNPRKFLQPGSPSPTFQYHDEISAVKKENAELKNKLNDLDSRVKALQSTVTQLTAKLEEEKKTHAESIEDMKKQIQDIKMSIKPVQSETKPGSTSMFYQHQHRK